MIAAGHLGAGGGHYLVGLMWSPAAAAFVTVHLRRGNLRSLGLSTVGGKFTLIGCQVHDTASPVALYFVLIATVGTVRTIVYALRRAFPSPAR